jgi:hypothetical protein
MARCCAPQYAMRLHGERSARLFRRAFGLYSTEHMGATRLEDDGGADGKPAVEFEQDAVCTVPCRIWLTFEGFLQLIKLSHPIQSNQVEPG